VIDTHTRIGGRFSAAKKDGAQRRGYKSIKVWPDLGIFFFADPVYFFQIIRAPKWTRGDNSLSQHRPDTG
jgi:hypothetical protein